MSRVRIPSLTPENSRVADRAEASGPVPADGKGAMANSSPRAGLRNQPGAHGQTATSIIVFGRGLAADEAGAIRLSRASAMRADALANYVEENLTIFRSRRGRIVFSGGWPWATAGGNEVTVC